MKQKSAKHHNACCAVVDGSLRKWRCNRRPPTLRPLISNALTHFWFMDREQVKKEQGTFHEPIPILLVVLENAKRFKAICAIFGIVKNVPCTD